MRDLIVVGAGPAGTSAAGEASRLGLNVLLIDKEKFPREKICAGLLSERAMSYLDFEVPEDLIEEEVYGARVHYKSQVIERRVDYRIAISVTRKKFDHFLLQKSKEMGVDFVEEEKVTGLETKEDFVKVVTNRGDYEATAVIGADGINGTTKVYVRSKDPPEEYGVCLETKVKKSDYIENAVDIHLGLASGGYGWVIPHDNYFSVGVGGIASKVGNIRNIFEKFLSYLGFETSEKIRGFSIPSGGISRNLVKDRIILCGDAAGFVDSFFGEGIAYAILSGKLAGGYIYNAIKSGKLSKRDLKPYESLCEGKFGHNLKYSLLLSRIMHNFPNIFFKVLTSNPSVVEKYLELPAQKLEYKGLMKWLLPRMPYFYIKTLF